MANFSIIICSYNPDKILLNRLLTVIKNFENNNLKFEVIIIDNNCTVPLSSYFEIKDFLKSIANTSIIIENSPGLTNARIAGIKASKHEWIVFFDDDNEPAIDYLLQISVLIEHYPKVGVWGPGIINIEFIGDVSHFALTHMELFQKRSMTETVTDNVRWEQDAYPYGTGMAVRKNILQEYIRQVNLGNYTMSDRLGKSLISGGDIQILLTGIKMGYYAGSSPMLKLNHLIKSEKTKFKKMLELAYMLSASAVKAYNQVFTDAPFKIRQVSNKNVWHVIYQQVRMYLFKKPLREILFLLSRKMGELEAPSIACSSLKRPYLLQIYYKLISG